jgi:hypothetical protein
MCLGRIGVVDPIGAGNGAEVSAGYVGAPHCDSAGGRTAGMIERAYAFAGRVGADNGQRNRED